MQIIETDKNGALERGLFNQGLHVLEKPEHELRGSMKIIKRPPIRDRRITLKQRIEEGTQFDYAPRLGRPSPGPERELSGN